MPEDLLLELEKNKEAREFFSELDSRNRYAILYRIHDARRPETRARRIAKYVAMLAKQKKPYPEPTLKPRRSELSPRSPRETGIASRHYGQRTYGA
jgi:Bacteriocin-protection, YdeI or OmpD-Associated